MHKSCGLIVVKVLNLETARILFLFSEGFARGLLALDGRRGSMAGKGQRKNQHQQRQQRPRRTARPSSRTHGRVVSPRSWLLLHPAGASQDRGLLCRLS